MPELLGGRLRWYPHCLVRVCLSPGWLGHAWDVHASSCVCAQRFSVCTVAPIEAMHARAPMPWALRALLCAPVHANLEARGVDHLPTLC